jgi:hypothetical protein
MLSSQPPPVPDGLTPEQQAALLTTQGHAYLLHHKAAGVYLLGSASPPLDKMIAPEAFHLHVEQLLVEAGNPTDPIERMLVEQIALAYHMIGRLYVEAATAKTTDHAKVANAAAARLLGEFRRCTLTLKRYREPTPRPLTLVQQQNLAAGDQQIAYVEQPRGVGHIRNDATTQQGLKEVEYVASPHNAAGRPELNDRSAELRQARSQDPGGHRTAAANCPAEPPVGEIDRASDGRGSGPERGERQEAAKRRVIRPGASAGDAGGAAAAGTNGSLPAAGGVAVGHELPDPLGVDWQRLAAIRTQLMGSTPAPQRAEPSGPPARPEPGRKPKAGKRRSTNDKELVAAQ